MPVYVDSMRAKYGRLVLSHMWADTLEELLVMADKIGVDRKWIQGHPTLSFGKHRDASWVHFDIAQNKRSDAIIAGAIPTDKYGPVEHKARRLLSSPDPAHQLRGAKLFASVVDLRLRKRVSEW